MSRIEFTDVHHHYGRRSVLSDINLILNEQRIGIVGANGSGKSTLARMINGLVVPDRGTVRVGGLDVARHGRQVRRAVGFVFTDPDNQIVMPTVAEDVAFSLRRSGLGKDLINLRVAETLRRFGLADHADHPAHLLSGGQKQLLALAAVLVTDPQVIVADEPTTLLDARNSAMIASLLARLEQQVIMVTHQLELVRGFDRVIVLADGRVVADDTPALALATYQDLLSLDEP